MTFRTSGPFALAAAAAVLVRLLPAIVAGLALPLAATFAQDAAPTETVKQRITGPYRIEIRTHPAPGIFSDPESSFSIWRDGRIVFLQTGNDDYPVTYDFAQRQTGRGKWSLLRFAASDQSPLANLANALVIREDYSSIHCCSSALIFLLRPRFVFVGEVRGAFWWNRQVDQQVKADLLVFDRLDMPDPIPAYIYCEVNLQLRQSTLHIDQGLQRRPPYSDRFLKARAAKIRERKYWGEASDLLWPEDNSRLIQSMSALIYSGNANQARRLMNLAWRPDIPGKTEWARKFWAQLRQSPYWTELETLARVPVPPGAVERDDDPRPICYEIGE